MISNRNVDLNSLVTIDSSGLNVASFVDIKRVLIDKYKEIYGKDIDLSTGNADGEFVNELSLMLNNILQSMSTLYGNLDVNTASGVYLDALCALSNVHRKQPTSSRATVEIYNDYQMSIVFQQGREQFEDQSGMIWDIEESFVLGAGESKTINVVCSTLGPVKAPSGWITTLIGFPRVSVTQDNAATVGESLESDTSLRARRNQFISPMGTTVLQSLAAALLDIQAIKDVKIYNNQSDNIGTSMTALDGTTVTPHGIYVVIRQTDNQIDVDDNIANTIYGKLTPGIQTTQSNVTAERKYKTYIPTILGLTVSSYNETIYWRLAVPVHPTITLQYTEVQNSGYDPDTNDLIGNAMFDYLNNLPLGKTPNINEVVMEMLMADPRQKGISTITVDYTNINLSNVSSNADTYYNYTSCVDSNPNGPIHILTLS